ncbi:MAG: hypothetical protein WBP73_09185, partial [Terriglobales bacterium]
SLLFSEAGNLHNQRGIWRDLEAQIETGRVLFRNALSASGWAKRFCFLYNAETQFHRMRP